MGKITTPGRALIEDALPEDMRANLPQLNKKGFHSMLTELGQRHPDRYREVLFKLSQIGHRASYESGGFSPSLDAFRSSPAAIRLKAELQSKVDQLLDDDDISDEEREAKIIELTHEAKQRQVKEVFAEALAAKNPLALQVASGMRGNPGNLPSLIGWDGLYVDHLDRTIPVPVLNSYSQGLEPIEYFAGSFGARKGVVDTKQSVADAGYLGKQLVQVAHRLLVTAIDDERDDPTPRGIPVFTDDRDNVGALLAIDTAKYPKNTVLTPSIIKDIKDQGVARILVRSPIGRGAEDGGLYSRDMGIREHNRLPRIGEVPGITAGQAGNEKLTQGGLSSKHSGGVSGAAANLAVSGFKLIEQLLQVPKHFPGGAAHSQLDGRVDSVVEAPAGGHYVSVSGTQHYVPTGHTVQVRVGDKVEAGDTLSDGIINPAEVTRHRGVGEGQRRFATSLVDAFNGAGLALSRRNAELIARGLVNHVRLTQEMGDYGPDDVVQYSTLEHSYQPRQGARESTPALAVGKYLERPYLHYTIGCFDDQTEALTARGWVPWPEVRDDDLLASIDDDQLIFEQPLAVTRAPYAGELYAYSGRFVDYAVTPNHRFLVSRYSAPKRGWYFETADNIHRRRFRVPQFGFPQQGEATTSIRIGPHDLNYGDYAELVGWWASEGATTDRETTLYQIQSVNPDKFARIESLVMRLPFSWRYNLAHDERTGLVLKSPELSQHLKAYGTHFHNKRLPRHLLSQPPGVLRRTFEAMLAGDGHCRHEATGDTKRYNTSSRGLADDFQELCIRMGSGALVSGGKSRRGNYPEWYCGVAVYRTVAVLDADNNKEAFSKFEYSGTVYCAEMRTGLLYVRRNGKPMVSGNSKVRPSMLPDFKDFGVQSVMVHDDEPPFQPEMIRAAANLHYDPDWMVRQFGSNLKHTFQDAVHRGLTSDRTGTSFVPGLAHAKDFGLEGLIKTPTNQDDDLLKPPRPN